jgi:hypothetical protein
LSGSGVPVEGEAGVGYLMREGYDLPPVMFSEEEMVALTAGARMVAAWGGTSMARGAESALEKIAAVVPDAVRARAERLSLHAWGGIPPGHAIRETIDAIEAATDVPHRVHIAYTDEADARTDRVVRPLGLWFWGKVWTLVAWCELRGISGCSGSTGSRRSTCWNRTRRIPIRTSRPSTAARRRGPAATGAGQASDAERLRADAMFAAELPHAGLASSMLVTTASGRGRRASASASLAICPTG